MSTSVNAGSDSTTELDNPTNPPNQGAWYDIENGCYVREDCVLPLGEDGLAPTVAQDNQPSPWLSKDSINTHTDGNTQRTSEVGTLPLSSNEDGEHECGENASELERDMLLAFKEQDDLSSAHSPNPVHPQYFSSESAQPEMGQEPNQNGASSSSFEELSHGSPFHSQPQEEAEGEAIPLEQQPLVKMVDEVGEVEDGSSKSDHAEQAGKRPYWEEREKGR